ncbi:MAG: hypothetical protein ACRDZP_00700, partial [Acidimicrobiales bacterium]
RARWATLVGGLFALSVVGLDLGLAWPVVHGLERADHQYGIYPILMITWAGAFVVGTVVASILARRRGASIVAAILVLDALVMFGMPELSAPSVASPNLGPARYLASHLGSGRFFTLGPYHPDYGDYFELASANSDDVPVPKLWATYVTERLAPNANPTIFDGARVESGSGSTAAGDVVRRLPAYEDIGVRYVLADTTSAPFGPGPTFVGGIQRVYRDARVTIYSLPHPRPYFSTPGSSCTLTSHGDETLVARCPAPARLLRLELGLRGWTATVDGSPAPIGQVAGGLTSLQLPAGRSSVSFSYAPEHLDLALALFGAGWLVLLAVPLADRRRTAPQPASTGEAA